MFKVMFLMHKKNIFLQNFICSMKKHLCMFDAGTPVYIQ